MERFTGYEYVCIDIANAYGLDKELFSTRIKWVEDHIDKLDDFIPHADKKPLYVKGVMALDKIRKGEPTGHMVGLDACASGPQIMGVLLGCPDTCENTGLVDPSVRTDLYTEIYKEMVRLQPELAKGNQITRKEIKEATVPMCYGSVAKPKEIFGEFTEEYSNFYRAISNVAPAVITVLDILKQSWVPFSSKHEWTMPDGFNVSIKVMQHVDTRIEVDELDHARFTHRMKENLGTHKGISLAANVIHSIDGYIARELVRRCSFDRMELEECHTKLLIHLDGFSMPEVTNEMVSLALLDDVKAGKEKLYSNEVLYKLLVIVEKTLLNTAFEMISVHDEFKTMPNNMNRVREVYLELMQEMGDSDLLQDIINEITQSNHSISKTHPDIASVIADSNYFLS